MSWVCRGVRMGMVTLSVAMAVTRVAGFAMVVFMPVVPQLSLVEQKEKNQAAQHRGQQPVSYTHLTLPTKRIV